MTNAGAKCRSNLRKYLTKIPESCDGLSHRTTGRLSRLSGGTKTPTESWNSDSIYVLQRNTLLTIRSLHRTTKLQDFTLAQIYFSVSFFVDKSFFLQQKYDFHSLFFFFLLDLTPLPQLFQSLHFNKIYLKYTITFID